MVANLLIFILIAILTFWLLYSPAFFRNLLLYLVTFKELQTLPVLIPPPISWGYLKRHLKKGGEYSGWNKYSNQEEDSSLQCIENNALSQKYRLTLINSTFAVYCKTIAVDTCRPENVKRFFFKFSVNHKINALIYIYNKLIQPLLKRL